jgi:hypothetical protein
VGDKQYAVQIDSAAITDSAGNAYAGISNTAALNFTVYNSPAGQASISLGSLGKLIAPIQVEGNWYYFYDRSGDGFANDYITFNALATNLGTTASAITESNRTFTLNGVTVKLPTYGGPVGADGKLASNGYKNGTTYSALGNDATPNSNTTYDDLLAIWDAKNGTGTGTGAFGVPAGWGDFYYWSATPSASGHASVGLGNGYVRDGTALNDGYVAFQVL